MKLQKRGQNCRDTLDSHPLLQIILTYFGFMYFFLNGNIQRYRRVDKQYNESLCPIINQIFCLENGKSPKEEEKDTNSH